MNTPEQLADAAISEALDHAIGPRPRHVDEDLKSKIWHLIREAQVEISQQHERDGQ